MTPDELIALRHRLGLTQAEAGLLVGVEGRTWRRWEAGEMIPGPAERLLRLIETHGVLKTLQRMQEDQ